MRVVTYWVVDFWEYEGSKISPGRNVVILCEVAGFVRFEVFVI